MIILKFSFQYFRSSGIALVSQYGVLICTVHQVIGVMVPETLVQLLQ